MNAYSKWQRLFDTAYVYHVLQGNPLGFSYDINGRVQCSYSKKCAVGANLTDEERAAIAGDTYLESSDPAKLLTSEKLNITSFDEHDTHFLGVLQRAHDLAADRDYGWATIDANGVVGFNYLRPANKKSRRAVCETNYRRVAKLYNLTIPRY